MEDAKRRLHPFAAAALLLGIFALSSAARIGTALADANFDVERPEGMLKSDPGLLYYLTERILDAGGGVPQDFSADPRIQYPEVTDAAAEFTVGQEFRGLGPSAPGG